MATDEEVVYTPLPELTPSPEKNPALYRSQPSRTVVRNDPPPALKDLTRKEWERISQSW